MLRANEILFMSLRDSEGADSYACHKASKRTYKSDKWCKKNRQGLLQNLACILATIRPVETYKGVFGTPIGIRTQTVRTGI